MKFLENLIAGILVAFFLGVTYPPPSIVLIVIGFVAGFFVPAIVRFGIALVYLPAKIYREQGGFIENPFEITDLDPKLIVLDSTSRLAATKNKWATIKVYNKSHIASIEESFIELVGILDLKTNQPIQIEKHRLTWSGRDQNRNQKGNELLTIQADSDAWCDVAVFVHVRKAAFYTTWFGLEHMRIDPGEYRLTLKAHGRWKNHSLSYLYLAYLQFDLPNDIRITRVEEYEQKKSKAR